MTSLHRVVINWAGPNVVGNAVTVLHYSASDNAAPPMAALQAAFQANQALFNQDTTFSFPSSGDTIDDTTGNLVGTWVVPDQNLSTSGNSPAAVAAGVGACIAWTTGGIVNGKKGPRKLRGRTFLVPITVGCYETNGTLTSTALATAKSLAQAIAAAGPLAIWHRPTTVGGTDGNSYGVQSWNVRDKVAVLRSRRD